MNKFRLATLALLLLSLLAIPASALAAPVASNSFDDVVIFGEDYVLAAVDTVDGTVMVFGGNVSLEAGSTVEVDVVSFGGDIVIDGTVQGSVIALGGDVTLGEAAVVEEDVTTFGGHLESAAGAQVMGNTFTNMRGFNFNFPRDFNNPEFQFEQPGPRGFFGERDGMVHNLLGLLFTTLAMSTIALLVALFVPDHLRRTANAIVAESMPATGLGFLSLFLLPFVLLITIITIIGPVILGFLATAAVAFGWIALGLEVGRRMAEAFKGSWSPVVQAWLGTIVITLVAGVVGWVPCFGAVALVALASLGLGGVMFTRFGARVYPAPSDPTRKQVPRTTPRKRAKK